MSGRRRGSPSCRSPSSSKPVRTPIGKRNGYLSGMHAAEILAVAQIELVKRTGIDPADVDQLVGGCVTQAGEQASNVTRNAWLSLGFPTSRRPPPSTASAARHSRPTTSCRASLRPARRRGRHRLRRRSDEPRRPRHERDERPRVSSKPDNFPWDMPDQFQAAERIAEKRGITREDVDGLGLRSQTERGAGGGRGTLRSRDRADGSTGHGSRRTDRRAHRREQGPGPARDDCRRPRQVEARLPDGMHTAGNSSQISDGAAAVLWMSEDRAKAEGRGRGPRSSPRPSSAPIPTTSSTARAKRPRRCCQGGHDDGRHRPVRGQRSVRVGRVVVGQGAQPRLGQGQRERRRDRARSPGRLDRLAPDHAPRCTNSSAPTRSSR